MTVTTADMPSKCAKFRFEIPQVDDLTDGLVGLKLVVVNYDMEIVELVLHGVLKSLEILPLLEFAVTSQNEHAPATTRVPLRPRDAPPLRDSHAERAGVELDSRNMNFRVTVEPAEAAEPA